MNSLAAKFRREDKEHPSHWIIAPTRAGIYRLEYIGPPRTRKKTKEP